MSKAPDDIDAYIGARLRLRRQSLGMSQEQLGQSLGLTFQQVQKYEKGLNRIGAGRLFHIASILDVEVGFFYEGLRPASNSPLLSAEHDAAVRRFLSTSEGYRLSQAFCRIDSEHTRRRLLELVSTIAESEGAGPKASAETHMG
ncbi:MAG: helix-turn-helix transcriptional regulator [Pseudomonadota bacterium]